MRISADKRDPDYTEYPMIVRVFLDGVQLKSCITADDEKGYVICYAMDNTGKLIFDPRDGEVLVSCSYGVVRIELPDYWRAL